jgi:hypothetical protein
LRSALAKAEAKEARKKEIAETRAKLKQLTKRK